MSLEEAVNTDEAADAAVAAQEPQVYSVSELNKAIRKTLEGQFSLVWLRAEISNFKAHSSGHFYFCLKDKDAQINAVMFRGFNNRLKFRPEDGMEVLVRGKVTVYEPRGTYQIFCEVMEPVGAGALQIAFEQLKAKLQAEGLFEAARKRPIPALPRHIAIVTSPTGAAIRDILNVLGRRFRGVRITLIPAVVQGEQAPASIIQAIAMANRLQDVDVMIVGRGGGSIEDLWAFNDEGVARAIAAAKVPVISAVGHEIDFTIADFVADLRAPTPSAAAELVVQNAADLVEKIRTHEIRFRQAQARFLESLHQRIQNLTSRLVDPQRRLQDLVLRCDDLQQRLELAVQRFFENRKTLVLLTYKKMRSPMEVISRYLQKTQVFSVKIKALATKNLESKQAHFAKLAALLDSLSPLRVVDRGYSIASLKNGQIVKSARQLKVGDALSLRFAEGSAEAQVVNLNLDNPDNKEVNHGL